MKRLQANKIKKESELKIKITEDEWAQMFINIFKCTNATKLREFHYKILNSILTTNYLRNRYDPNTSNLCVFCHTAMENNLPLICAMSRG